MVNDNDQSCFLEELARAPRCTYVVAFSERIVYKGCTLHGISERLIDILNQGSVLNNPESASDYLPLIEVEICDLGGKQLEVTPNCLLNKNNTLLVAERNIICGELPPSKPFRYTLFHQKKPVWVSIQIQDFNVVGQVYIGQNEMSITALEMSQTFIPVTTATLSSKIHYLQSEFDFMAINKNQIISISEISR
jgi:hypothetical protein